MQTIVFAATSGIAQATVRLLAAQGDALVLVARDGEKLEKVAADARLRGSPAVTTVTTDLGDTRDHAALVERAIETLGGRFDQAYLFQGMLPDQAKAEGSVELLEETFRINCLSVLSLLTHLSNRGRQLGFVTIVVVSSVAGDRGRGSNYVYGSAKAAVSRFMEGLRHRFHGTSVRFVEVRPGMVDTAMTAHLKKGLLFSAPATVAPLIVRAADRGTPVAYVPGYWRLIMLIVRYLPAAVLHRSKL